MIKEIRHNGTLAAILVNSIGSEDGTHPITDPSGALQLLMMKRSAGHVFAKHTHKIMERASQELQEAIVVTKGKLQITVCDRDGKDIESVDVSSGECLFLVRGGYGVEVVEDAEFFEFKNGPHSDDKVLL